MADARTISPLKGNRQLANHSSTPTPRPIECKWNNASNKNCANSWKFTNIAHRIHLLCIASVCFLHRREFFISVAKGEASLCVWMSVASKKLRSFISVLERARCAKCSIIIANREVNKTTPCSSSVAVTSCPMHTGTDAKFWIRAVYTSAAENKVQ